MSDILNEVEGHAESAKLLRVRQLIEALLREHDVCAQISVIGRGRVEVFTHLEASWSCIRLVKIGDGFFLKMRSKKEEYPSPEAQRVAVAATAGMARSLFEINAEHCHEWAQASAYIDAQLGAEHSPLMPVEDKGGMH